MKLKRFAYLCLMLFFLVFIKFGSAVSGVIPAKYNIDFYPNLEREFSFTFVNDFEDSEIYLEGDLSESFQIVSDKKMNGNRIIVVKMNLPEKAQKAGMNRVVVGCKEIGNQKGVNIVMNVRGVIDINVPYPEKYADIEFDINYVNQGESAFYNLTVYSKGEESIFVKPRVELRTLGDLVDVIYLDGRFINSLSSEEYLGEIDTNNYLAGDYNITVIVEYGGDLPRSETKLFRVGELHMEITNYTSKYIRGGLNRINIIIESFWNNEIDNVFVNGSVIGYPYINFKSPSSAVEPWSSKVFESYFDTSDIVEKNFQLSIDINYGEKITNKIVNVYFEEKTNWTLIIILAIISLIILLIVIIIFLLYKK